MLFDGVFTLFDILGTTLSKGRLSLSIPLFSLFRSSIYLQPRLDEVVPQNIVLNLPASCHPFSLR